jgi:hypothetical protein
MRHSQDLVRPREWESLLTEEAFEREELLPYWAHLWGSAVALAEAVVREQVGGRRGRRPSSKVRDRTGI